MNWGIATRIGRITFDRHTPTPNVISYDAATTAWAAAVVSAGGTVSTARKGYVDALVVGLKADSLWSGLDALLLFAVDNTQSALIDVKSLLAATAVSSPTFDSVNFRGYTGNGSSAYINSNFNPSTASSPNFVRDSACYFAWSNTSGADGGGLAGVGFGSAQSRLFPQYVDTNCYWTVNSLTGSPFNAGLGATGLYSVNRSGASQTDLYLNGVATYTNSDGSNSLVNDTLVALAALGGGNFSSRQCCCLGAGRSFNATEQGNLYSRLRTYMTSAGVP